jgi:hypothetical protein
LGRVRADVHVITLLFKIRIFVGCEKADQKKKDLLVKSAIFFMNDFDSNPVCSFVQAYIYTVVQL